MENITNQLPDLTDPNLIDAIKNAPINNFFVYAFIVFAVVMIVGLVSVVWIFSRRDAKKDQRQNEQYKNLLNSQTEQYKQVLDGYKQMIDQNSKTNTEFRTTIDNIGVVLRELSNTIAKNEAQDNAKEDKFDIMLHRFDSMKEELSRSNGAIHQAFREHEQYNHQAHANLDKSIQKVTLELKRNVEWCKTVNSKGEVS